MLRTMASSQQQQEGGSEELTARLQIMQEYTKRLEDEINQLRLLLEQQQQLQRPSSSISGSVSPRELTSTGSEENEIDLLVQQMIQAFPTGQEPGNFLNIRTSVGTPLLITCQYCHNKKILDQSDYASLWVLPKHC